MLLMLRETVKKKCGKFHTRVSNGLKWLQGVENDLVQIPPPPQVMWNFPHFLLKGSLKLRNPRFTHRVG